VIGHCWPVFLKFNGGKGAATAIGVFLALSPLPLLCSLPIGLAVIFFTSNITLGLSAGFLFLPLFVWLFHLPLNLILFIIVLILFLGVRYLRTAKRNLNKTGWRDFLIEKNYTPWQRPRKK
jgi:glycerol-3-phosphate acyltransferase PlsY